MYVKVMTKRAAQIEVGDIVRSMPGEYQVIPEWSMVDTVENSDELSITRMRWHRPRATDGRIVVRHSTVTRGEDLSAWSLFEVQTLATQSGEAR